MAEPVYTRAFWEKALELASKAPKQCEGCHGYTKLKGEGRRRVRVVCLTPDNPTPKSLALICTTCKPEPVVKLPSRSQILAKIMELPFEQPEAPKSAHA